MQPTRGDFFIDCVRRIRRGRCVYPGGGGGEVIMRRIIRAEGCVGESKHVLWILNRSLNILNSARLVELSLRLWYWERLHNVSSFILEECLEIFSRSVFYIFLSRSSSFSHFQKYSFQSNFIFFIVKYIPIKVLRNRFVSLKIFRLKKKIVERRDPSIPERCVNSSTNFRLSFRMRVTTINTVI